MRSAKEIKLNSLILLLKDGGLFLSNIFNTCKFSNRISFCLVSFLDHNLIVDKHAENSLVCLYSEALVRQLINCNCYSRCVSRMKHRNRSTEFCLKVAKFIAYTEGTVLWNGRGRSGFTPYFCLFQERGTILTLQS